MRILCVYRDNRYSPNSAEKDRAILDAVGKRLSARGHSVSFVHEKELNVVNADLCLSMARSPEALRILSESGVRCVNSAEGIELCCHRKVLDDMMRAEGVLMPPLESTDGYWLKRGDGPAEEKDDVVFCANEQELAVARQRMAERGISEQVVSAHVAGDLIKFYGVCGTGFFRYFYPADDGISKFGAEGHNGKAHHYAFDVRQLIAEAEKLAALTHVDVYGGDCVVREDGSLAVIDFNDWPSFSRCREEAADAVAGKIISKK